MTRIITLGRRAFVLAGLAAAAAPAFAAETPPVIFVHGNGDTAGLWIATLWRFESNAYPRDRLFALDLRYPQAGSVFDKAQPGRSTAEEVMRQLAAEVTRVKALTGAAKVVLVGQSRGGNTVRNYIKNGGGAAHVSLAVLCGAVNHGVVVSDKFLIGSEFNGASAFMKDLNSAPGEVVAGVRYVTLRSDSNDKFAQPDGAYLGMKGVPTGVGFDAPALAGAENLVLPGADHREAGYGLATLAPLFKAITGAAPATLVITPEAAPVLDGKVSGFEAGAPTNIGLDGARVTIWRVDPANGARLGAAAHDRITGEDGIWGPFTADPVANYEFVVAAAGYPVTHIYRAPFPRSSAILHLRPQPLGAGDADATAVLYMSRPRGYFGGGRDKVLLNGQPVADVPPGVPTVSTTRMMGEAGAPVVGSFNDETIPARLWPAKGGHVSVIEVTG